MISGLLESGRYIVQLEDGEHVRIKPSNLIFQESQTLEPVDDEGAVSPTETVVATELPRKPTASHSDSSSEEGGPELLRKPREDDSPASDGLPC